MKRVGQEKWSSLSTSAKIKEIIIKKPQKKTTRKM
jgi:hypothetical protein